MGRKRYAFEFVIFVQKYLMGIEENLHDNTLKYKHHWWHGDFEQSFGAEQRFIGANS